MKSVRVGRRATFNAAHRLFNPAWSNEKNDEVFGACNNPNYHGHNYELKVWVCGYTQPETGYLIDLKLLKSIIKEEVIEPFDHRNLNLDVADFKNLNPTAENIAYVIYERIIKKLPDDLSLEIHLNETENNLVIYPG